MARQIVTAFGPSENNQACRLLLEKAICDIGHEDDNDYAIEQEARMIGERKAFLAWWLYLQIWMWMVNVGLFGLVILMVVLSCFF